MAGMLLADAGCLQLTSMEWFPSSCLELQRTPPMQFPITLSRNAAGGYFVGAPGNYLYTSLGQASAHLGCTLSHLLVDRRRCRPPYRCCTPCDPEVSRCPCVLQVTPNPKVSNLKVGKSIMHITSEVRPRVPAALQHAFYTPGSALQHPTLCLICHIAFLPAAAGGGLRVLKQHRSTLRGASDARQPTRSGMNRILV